MKKVIASLLAVAMVTLTFAPSAQAAENDGRGGVVGFFAGCCLGVRTGTDYNSGKEIHWRDWAPIIPYVGIIFSLWNGVECAGGMTRADLAETYGSTYY